MNYVDSSLPAGEQPLGRRLLQSSNMFSRVACNKGSSHVGQDVSVTTVTKLLFPRRPSDCGTVVCRYSE